MSRSRNEILQLRDALVKAVESESREAVKDILKALRGMKITADVLKSTKIGLSVNITKKKYSDEVEITSLAKELISIWKNVYNAAQLNQAKSGEEASDVPNTHVARQLSATNEELALSEDLKHAVGKNAEGRNKIVALFVNCFSSGCDQRIAQALGYGVESIINDIHPFSSDVRGYQNKARKLLFNLKKNEELKQSVLDGTLSVQSLVHMPTSALATQSLAEIRNKASAEAHDASRSDWESAHRDEILQQNGLDPSRGTEFKCHKCKQTKTTMYAVQTRSADEPMTLFVTCLTCGFHWKTQ